MSNKHEKNDFKPFSNDLIEQGREKLQNLLKSNENDQIKDQAQLLMDGFVNLYCKMQTEIEEIQKQCDDWKERAIKAQSNK